MLKRLPIGYDIFDDVIKKDFYYVDKTLFISDLVKNGSLVNLFTRPRRFGKSLNMSMLRHFFSIGADKTLFNGLKISDDKEFCEKYQGKFPVISISLKCVEGNNYDVARNLLLSMVTRVANDYRYILESNRLDQSDKEDFVRVLNLYKSDEKADKEMRKKNDGTLGESFYILSKILYKHFNKKTIILIDEYDVPLASGFYNGYYDNIISLIRNFFSNALKTNEYLELAVLTGCLRIAKESIFTGLNNFKVFTVSDKDFSSSFGFTHSEVYEMFKYYGVEDKFEAAKKWYDGYHIGDNHIFASWDVINYASILRNYPEENPSSYWAQTSSNRIIKTLLEMVDENIVTDLETLTSGGTVTKNIKHDITYNELYSSVDNIWSVMLATGYLTVIEKKYSDIEEYCVLAIPNYEIRKVYKEQIEEWFKYGLKNKKTQLTELQKAFLSGDAETAENVFNDFLINTISLRDDMQQEDAKESFYHGILLGLLSSEYAKGCLVRSNKEAGKGYCDIYLTSSDRKTGAIIELKLAKSDDEFDSTCDKALEQINSRQYTDVFRPIITKTIYKYGISCRQKYCRIKLGN